MNRRKEENPQVVGGEESFTRIKIRAALALTIHKDRAQSHRPTKGSAPTDISSATNPGHQTPSSTSRKMRFSRRLTTTKENRKIIAINHRDTSGSIDDHSLGHNSRVSYWRKATL